MPLLLAAALVVFTACGTTQAGAPPTPSAIPSASAAESPTPPASPSPSGSPPEVRAGQPAYVAVAVATLWRSPQAARPVDAPAVANPVRIREWLAGLDAAAQRDLIGRADSQVLLGERIDVLAISGDWAKVVVPDQATPLDARGYPGWIPLSQLTADAPILTQGYVEVVAPTAWLLDHGARSMEISFGTRLAVLSHSGAIFHVATGAGSFDIASSSVAYSEGADPPLPATPAAVLDSMRLFLSVRYLWAGTAGFGFDCSGLVYTVFKAHGILLPRDAQDQANAGTPVSRAALAPGDLVFLASGGVVHHVALYVGGGMLLDSPDLGRGVQLVSMNTAPYSTEYAGARRVI